MLELLEKETLDKAEVEAVFSDLSSREPRPAWTGSSQRAPDVRGPISVPANGAAPHGASNGVSHAHAPADNVAQRSEESR